MKFDTLTKIGSRYGYDNDIISQIDWHLSLFGPKECQALSECILVFSRRHLLLNSEAILGKKNRQTHV